MNEALEEIIKFAKAAKNDNKLPTTAYMSWAGDVYDSKGKKTMGFGSQAVNPNFRVMMLKIVH